MSTTTHHSAVETGVFDEEHTLHILSHFLPAQSPLKDFVHHNTLHAFQEQQFFQAIKNASSIFGYKTSLSLPAFRKKYKNGAINDAVIDRIISEKKGDDSVSEWREKLIVTSYDTTIYQKVGNLRATWKKKYKTDLDALVHTTLFKVINSYLDQGVSLWRFPETGLSFLNSVKKMEENSFSSFFKTKRAKAFLMRGNIEIQELLEIIVHEESYYENYLIDQQFAHPGYSGMVSVVEHNPKTLLDSRKVTLKEFIIFELLLEIDALDAKFGETWIPIGLHTDEPSENLFAQNDFTELDEVLQLWQLSMEWTFYDQVLAGLAFNKAQAPKRSTNSFQALFCIDDRECSIRRYVEQNDANAKTFGTPGHFGLEFYFKPEHSKFTTKVCPAPVTPAFVIQEFETNKVQKKEIHFSRHANSILGGWIFTQTVGVFSAFRMLRDIFRPTNSPLATSSFSHMDKNSTLTIEHKGAFDADGLQIGFTYQQMTDRVKAVLNSIGLVSDFAPLVYLIGHGASSVNNTYYAGYDCGACSGRPGSVNARVFAAMANHPEVRKLLAESGIVIPESSQFIGGLHDTTRDEVEFYDEDLLSAINQEKHEANKPVFAKSLDENAQERSRRFVSIDSSKSLSKVHEDIKKRAVTLYEPRPELNHATNCLCIVGKRSLTYNLFLDRRAFMNTYDWHNDPEGNFLLNILNAAAPVCGGINLEYYFSRVDNYKLGAGPKLPHNVMGLIGVANGIEGDLRPGLPTQMTEMHDPLRLLMVIEHFPEVVLNTIQKNPATYEWFANQWVNLAIIHPTTKAISVFENVEMRSYEPLIREVPTFLNFTDEILSSADNIKVKNIA